MPLCLYGSFITIAYLRKLKFVSIVQVEEDLLDKFNYVAGIVPVLTAHISHVSHITVYVDV